MPELPEVESYTRALSKEYVGKTIAKIIFYRDSVRNTLDKSALRKVLTQNHVLTKIFRDGKQLVFETDSGRIHVSLGMSGSFLPAELKSPKKHEHITLVFTDGSALGYIDPRRFGNWEVRKNALSHLADPMQSTSLNRLFANKIWKKSTRTIKDALMDQKWIGGVGNIYALEALHLAHIHPKRIVDTLSTEESFALAEILPKLLMRAVDAGGSSISTYRRLHGDSGNFQELHLVYNREAEKCLKKNCSGKIVRIKHSGRSSWFCPVCQK